ncbi:MAG: hypothetical protein M3Q98_12885, partial [Actinomycetota bacterium]|nr:hypothetical protein [Actinomycetota bacterium]
MSRLRATVTAVALLAVLAGCRSTDTAEPKDAPTTSSAREDTCSEVRAGVDAYNAKNLDEVQPHFVRARVFAKRYAKDSSGAEADELLEAIEFFVKVPPSDYSKDAESAELFQKYKQITLGYC